MTQAVMRALSSAVLNSKSVEASLAALSDFIDFSRSRNSAVITRILADKLAPASMGEVSRGAANSRFEGTFTGLHTNSSPILLLRYLL